jgi:hypothetical protein
MKNIKFNYFLIYLIWIIFCLSIWLSIPIFDKGLDSSSQFQFVLRMYILIGLICGLFLISLFDAIRFKRILNFHGAVLILTGVIIVFFTLKLIIV